MPINAVLNQLYAVLTGFKDCHPHLHSFIEIFIHSPTITVVRPISAKQLLTCLFLFMFMPVGVYVYVYVCVMTD